MPEPVIRTETVHDDFGGLGRDQRTMIGRRHALRLLGGLGVVTVVAACGSSTDPDSTATAGDDADGATGEIPDETPGPFPADGTNGPNLLDDAAVVRSDITTSFGEFSGTAVGKATIFDLTVVDAATGDPVEGAALYLWHCTADGRYSLYEETDQNYLRGVQVTDAAGRVSFSSIFPGCYPGRWPHCHFEVFDSLDAADTGQAAVKTSQLALPQDACEAVYADAVYGSSAQDLSRLSLEGDGVFADGFAEQLATVSSGSATTVSLVIGI